MSGRSADRADELTRHIEKETIRERARKELANFFDDLEQINSYTEAGGDIDSDGIPSMTPSKWYEKEKQKADALQAAQVFVPSAVIVKPLIDDINARGQFGYTKLHRCVVDNDIAAVKQLLANPDICLDIRDNYDATAYDKAVNRDYSDIIALFKKMPKECGCLSCQQTRVEE